MIARIYRKTQGSGAAGCALGSFGVKMGSFGVQNGVESERFVREWCQVSNNASRNTCFWTKLAEK